MALPADRAAGVPAVSPYPSKNSASNAATQVPLPSIVSSGHSIPIQQLTAWLEKLRLTQYSKSAQDWCSRMGAVSVQEILENWEDFSLALQLKTLEKRRVEKDAAAELGCDITESSTPVSISAPVSSATPNASAASLGPGANFTAGGSSASNFFGPKEEPQRYEMREELGSGATATVCRCLRGESVFAVKTINLAKLKLQRDFQRISDRLQREVTLLFALRHPRIVSLYDVVEEENRLHLVMEFVDGGELFDHIVAMGSFTEPVARYVFLQIAEGLKYIHSKGIVYRDLKPENILVDKSASRTGLLEVKLSDFGHSKLINDGYSTALTRVGTPQYWAPEVSDPAKAAQGYNQLVDLWSLGVVLYVMLIGAYPFDGVQEPIEHQIRKARIIFPPTLHQPSPRAQELIRGLIQFKPESRLSLDNCLVHPWVAMGGGTLNKILKLCTEVEPCAIEERLPLPAEPSKAVVEVLRRDLSQWTTKYRCSATLQYGEVVANLQLGVPEEAKADARKELEAIIKHHFPSYVAKSLDGNSQSPHLPAVKEGSQREEGGRSKNFRLFSHILRVSNGLAGLDLQEERGGMRIENVCDEPGQPGLQPGDLIIKINEESLRGTPERVKQTFRKHFLDGASLTVKREQPTSW